MVAAHRPPPPFSFPYSCFTASSTSLARTPRTSRGSWHCAKYVLGWYRMNDEKECRGFRNSNTAEKEVQRGMDERLLIPLPFIVPAYFIFNALKHAIGLYTIPLIIAPSFLPSLLVVLSHPSTTPWCKNTCSSPRPNSSKCKEVRHNLSMHV